MKANNFLNDLEIFNYVKDLEKRGLNLFLENSKLKFNIDKNLYDESLIEDIRLRKDAIVDYLRTEEENTIDLSPLQLAYMAGQYGVTPLSSVNAHYYIEFEKDNINLEKLENKFNLIISRSEALRLIVLKNGKGLILDSVPDYKIESYIIGKEPDVQEMRENLSRKKYSIETWPMYTLVVGKSEDGSDVLHVSFDCSILDAWSAGIMIYTLFDLYSGEKEDFPEISYKEYMLNLSEYKNSAEARKNLEAADCYWERQSKSLKSSPKLKFRQKVKDISSIEFTRLDYTFPVNKTKQLYAYAMKNHVTLSSVVITIYMKALSRLSNEDELTVNATILGKMPVMPDIEKLIGEFTNIGLISYRENSSSIIKSIKETQSQIFKILEYRLYDGINIVNKMKDKKEYELGFPVVVTCMIGEEYSYIRSGFKEVYSLSQTPQVYLDHHIRIIDEQLVITFDYIKELFDKNYIEELKQNYIKIVDSICCN